MKKISIVATLLIVLGAWVIAMAANPPANVTINQVQRAADNGIALGDSVRVSNVIITGIDSYPSTYGFWAQEAGGGIYSGILCYTGSAFPTGLARGDIMTVKGVYAEYGSTDTSLALSEINSYYSWYWEKTGSTAVPAPTLLSCRDLGIVYTDAPRCERWEGTLVELDTVVCVRLDPTYPTSSFFLVEAHNHAPSTSADTVYVRNNKLISPGPAVPAVGDTLVSITGLHHYESSRYQICPRDGNDIVYKVTPAPSLAMAFSTLNTTVVALFDVKLDKTIAENVNNYFLAALNVIPTTATLGADEQTVTLTIPAETPGTYETLTAQNLKSKGTGGTVMPAAQNFSFRAGICPISYVQTVKSVLNDSSQYAGDEVTVAGIVTGDYADYTVQCYIENTPGGPWSGVQVYGGLSTVPVRGDSIIVAGFCSEYYLKTEITSVDYIRIVSSGNTIPGPNLVDPDQIHTGAASAESYEGVFVRCNPVIVADTTGWQGFGEWHVRDLTPDTVLVGHTGNYTYVPSLGRLPINICGPIDYVYNNHRIEPRQNADIDTVNVVSVDPGTQPKPQVFALEQNTPNPFNPVTNISFSIPERSKVQLYVYDISGRLVKTLVNGVSMAAGSHKASWDGSNDAGRAVSSGVYFCKLLAADKVAQMKMVVLK